MVEKASRRSGGLRGAVVRAHVEEATLAAGRRRLFKRRALATRDNDIVVVVVATLGDAAAAAVSEERDEQQERSDPGPGHHVAAKRRRHASRVKVGAGHGVAGRHEGRSGSDKQQRQERAERRDGGNEARTHGKQTGKQDNNLEKGANEVERVRKARQVVVRVAVVDKWLRDAIRGALLRGKVVDRVKRKVGGVGRAVGVAAVRDLAVAVGGPTGDIGGVGNLRGIGLEPVELVQRRGILGAGQQNKKEEEQGTIVSLVVCLSALIVEFASKMRIHRQLALCI